MMLLFKTIILNARRLVLLGCKDKLFTFRKYQGYVLLSEGPPRHM